jgi:hypothetical protein
MCVRAIQEDIIIHKIRDFTLFSCKSERKNYMRINGTEGKMDKLNFQERKGTCRLMEKEEVIRVKEKPETR